MAIIVTIISTDLLTNSLSHIFYFFLQKKIKFSASWWSGNEKYFCSLSVASRVLLQNYGELNRLFFFFNFFHVIPVRIITPC